MIKSEKKLASNETPQMWCVRRYSTVIGYAKLTIRTYQLANSFSGSPWSSVAAVRGSSLTSVCRESASIRIVPGAHKHDRHQKKKGSAAPGEPA
jgi:hypothetical protein